MRWLVDGMNVIGARPDGWWRDRRGAMRSLTELLDDFAEESADEVAVVFDGRRFEIQPRAIEVAFAAGPGPNAADRVIAERVEADPDPGTITVVTSDHALAERVRAAGASVAGAGAFRRRLDGVVGPTDRS
jgi:predicted RNA-binding protein with PIN domain